MLPIFSRDDGPHRRRPGRFRIPVPFLVLALLLLVGCGGKQPAPAREFGGPDPIVAIDAFITDRQIDTSDPNWKTHVPRPPVIAFPANEKYYWVLHTNVGSIKVELKQVWAPKHVAATIYLTQLGFYDGLDFHRIIPKFMAQGGDPLGTGAGGPGFRYGGEFHKKGKHDERGVVSMANSGPRTDGSQFFILFAEAPHLDDKHTVFGQVVEGFGTLRSMEAAGSQDGKPKRSIVIETAEILAP